MSVRRGQPEGKEGGAQGPAPTVTSLVFLLPVTRVQHVQEDNAAFPEGCNPAARPLCKWGTMGQAGLAASGLLPLAWGDGRGGVERWGEGRFRNHKKFLPYCC